MADLRIRPATEADVPVVLRLIRALAEYEKLTHEVVATEAAIRDGLFGPRRSAAAILAHLGEEPVGFALYFQTFSTFLGRPGIYLEDLFVEERFRGRGVGKRLLAHLAAIAVERGCGRLEWSVLDWNEPALRFYRSLGAGPNDGWTVYRLTGAALEDLARFRL
ncbi:MAG: GNAT family N-acetyltransferase [Candidatus Binatia bacterium]